MKVWIRTRERKKIDWGRCYHEKWSKVTSSSKLLSLIIECKSMALQFLGFISLKKILTLTTTVSFNDQICKFITRRACWYGICHLQKYSPLISLWIKTRLFKSFVKIFYLIFLMPTFVVKVLSRFSDLDRSLNRKRERFKVFEVEPRSNWGRTVMTS